MSNLITFSINSQILGVQVNDVEKIMNFTLITKIPGNKNYIEGVISYHDEIIPAVNLKKLLNLDGAEVSSEGQMIVINHNGRKAGIIVDEVREIEEVNDNVPFLKVKSQYVNSTIKLRDNMVSIINPEIVNIAD